jgi:hypothetical protein
MAVSSSKAEADMIRNGQPESLPNFKSACTCFILDASVKV